MLSLVALLPVRASFAAFTDVIALYDFILILSFPFSVISVIQLFAVRTSETVIDFIIAEILDNLALLSANLANLYKDLLS